MIVLSVAGIVVLLAVVLFGVARLTGSDDSPDSSSGPVVPSTATTAATGVPSEEPTRAPSRRQPTSAQPSSAPAGPVLCTGSTLRCFPKATVSSVSAILKSKGAVCKVQDVTTKCVRGGKTESIDVSLQPSLYDKRELSTFKALTFSTGAGANTAGRALVISNLKASMPTLMSAVLPGEPRTQQQVTGWLATHIENCPLKPVRIGGYDVGCEDPSRITVNDDKGSATSWFASLTIDATGLRR